MSSPSPVKPCAQAATSPCTGVALPHEVCEMTRQVGNVDTAELAEGTSSSGSCTGMVATQTAPHTIPDVVPSPDDASSRQQQSPHTIPDVVPSPDDASSR